VTDDPFVLHRSRLFTVAYEMLGSAADAEHVVQETWLRWNRMDPAEGWLGARWIVHFLPFHRSATGTVPGTWAHPTAVHADREVHDRP
jgi:Sigma-70 region 2